MKKLKRSSYQNQNHLPWVPKPQRVKRVRTVKGIAKESWKGKDLRFLSPVLNRYFLRGTCPLGKSDSAPEAELEEKSDSKSEIESE